MNKTNRRSAAHLLFLCVTVLLSTSTHGAEDTQKSAQHKIVRMPEGYSAWKIEVANIPPPDAEKMAPASQPPVSAPAPSAGNSASAKKDGAAKPQQTVGLPTRVEVTQDDEKRRCLVHWASGRDQIAWEYPRYKLVLSEGFSGNVTAAVAGNPDFSVPFVSGAFDWITPQNLVESEPVSFQGKQCFHYKGVLPVLDAKGHTTHVLKLQAWVDSTTLLPVALHDGTAMGTYTFQDSAEKLILPPKFLAKLSYFITVMGAGPYQAAPKRKVAR